MQFKAPFGNIMDVILILPLRHPPWTMSVGHAGTVSKDTSFHHLITNSRPWYMNPRQFPLSPLCKSQTHLKDRYSRTEFLRRAFVCQSQHSKSFDSRPLVDWSPRQRLDTTVCLSNINCTSFSYLSNSAGSMMSTYLTTSKWIEGPQKLNLQTVYSPFLSGSLLSIIQVVEKYVF